MRTVDLIFMSTALFICRQACTETQKFTILSIVSFNMLLHKVRELQSCQQYPSPVDMPTAYQSFLICLGVVFWFRFGFQCVLFLFLYFNFLIREVFFFYLPI